MEIIELINNLSLILSYFIPGYVFISGYRWSSFSNKKYDTPLLVKSIELSYIFLLLYKVIFNIEILTDFNVICLCGISAIIGLILGFFTRTETCNKLFDIFNIDRSLYDNIWVETIKAGDYIRVFMKDGCSYLGLCERLENDNREPIIVLYNYQKLSPSSDIIIDMSGKKNELIMLNTKDFEKIEVIKYSSNHK